MSQNMKTVIVYLLILLAAIVLNETANATLASAQARGENVVQHQVPGGRAEICVIPKHFQGADYSKSDVKTEQELCSMNAHLNTAVCPKLESTNPGLNFHSLVDGMTKEQVEAQRCEVSDPANRAKKLNKKLAKYKLSTSCSYTPSILAYYHFSRILGDVANVPPAVLRTFDLATHRDLANLAMRQAPAGQLIRETWSSLKSALDNPGSTKKRDMLFTDDLDQSYGALQENPRGETFYSEFFTKAGAGQSRAQAFRDRNAIYKQLGQATPLRQLVSAEFTAANLQALLSLKDASEMIVLDTILSQEDRFGNVHYIEKYYYRDQSDASGLPKIKSKKKLTPEEIATLGAVKVREMMLKDNDCGVSRSNRAKEANLLSGIAHISPVTYKRLIALDAVADSADAKFFFTNEALFTSTDWTKVRGNLRSVVNTLKEACRSGRLQLDLDLDAHFAGQPASAVSCD